LKGWRGNGGEIWWENEQVSSFGKNLEKIDKFDKISVDIRISRGERGINQINKGLRIIWDNLHRCWGGWGKKDGYFVFFSNFSTKLVKISTACIMNNTSTPIAEMNMDAKIHREVV
jgi:hypothetical protein